MIDDVVKNKKCSIQKAISYLVSEGMVQELSNLKKMPDDKCKEMCEAIGIKTVENDIYYNSFNIVFDNADTHDEFKHYLKISDKPEDSSLVFRLEIPEMNVNLWGYTLSKNPLLNNLIGG